jgi:hypothetical protein
MHRRRHQISGKAIVACAIVSYLCDLEHVEAEVEPAGALPHHLPILLVLLHRRRYSHHSRSLLPMSQKIPLLLVQSTFQGLLHCHACVLAATDHLYQHEGKTMFGRHL